MRARREGEIEGRRSMRNEENEEEQKERKVKNEDRIAGGREGKRGGAERGRGGEDVGSKIWGEEGKRGVGSRVGIFTEEKQCSS